MSCGMWGPIDLVSDNWETLSSSQRSVMLASTFVTITHSLGSIHEYISRDFNPDQPKELWDRLHFMFNRTNTHTQLILSKKWADLRWRSDHTVDSYLGEIAQLRAQHRSAGFPISDNIAFVKLISSLPALFDTEVSLMEDWELPDLDRARSLLLKRQDVVRKRKFEESHTPIIDVTAFEMKSESKELRKNPKHKKRKFSCFYCGKSGHIRPNCRQRIEDEKKGDRKSVV